MIIDIRNRRPVAGAGALALASVLSAACFLAPAVRAADSIEWANPVTAMAGGSWAALSWQVGQNEYGVGGVSCTYSVTAYIVYRTTTSGMWTQSGSLFVPCGDACITDTRAYVDTGLTPGVVYSYVVRAVGTTYADSATVWVESSEAFAGPVSPAPMNAAANSGDGWVRLDWTVATTCGSGETGITQYRILRATSPAMLGVSPYSRVITSDNGYTDTSSLVNLVEYYYLIFPGWPQRAPSYLVARPFRPLVPGGPPTAVRDPSGPKSIRVFWPPAPAPDTGQSFALAGYAVYRSDDGGGTMTLLATVPAGQLYYLDTIPIYGKTYVYLVRPVDSAGNAGEAYKLASVDVILPSNRVFLDRNRIRPARGETVEVDFQIIREGRVRVTVMTLTGEVVKRLWDAEQTGSYNPDSPFHSHYSTLPVIRWDGTNDSGRLVASGAYLVALEIGGSRDIRAIVVVR